VTTWPSISIVPELTSSNPATIPEQSRFATSGRSDEHDELAVLNRQVDVIDRHNAGLEDLRTSATTT
jgi:hypothetical protein